MDFWELPAAATVGSHLLALKAHAGRSLAEIAKDAGYAGRSSAQAFFREDYNPKSLPLEVATRLIPALSGHGDPKVRPEDILRLVKIPFERVGSLDKEKAPRIEVAEVEAATPTIPVYSQTIVENAASLLGFDLPAGNSISGLDLDSPIDWFFRPRPLKFTSGVYGLYVGYDNMLPRFEPGDVILLDPTRPSKAGEDVLVFLKQPVDRGGVRPVILARLAGRNARAIEFEQFTPCARFTVEAAHIDRMHRVFSTAELLYP